MSLKSYENYIGEIDLMVTFQFTVIRKLTLTYF